MRFSLVKAPRGLLLAALIGLASGPAAAGEVVVFAAASLRTALDEVAKGFSARSGHEVRISYAGSNTLARQILEGAPADIFVSAAENWMDEVEKAGLTTPGSRRDLLGNRLVLVAPASAEAAPEEVISAQTDLAARLDGGRLAMGMVESVPAGQYGRAALQSLGLWDGVAAHVAQSDNVRAALALVAAGEAPLGIVYATDAVAEPGVRVAGVFPEESHPAILYPAALLAGAEEEAERAFFDELTSQTAREIFTAQGFRPLF